MRCVLRNTDVLGGLELSGRSCPCQGQYPWPGGTVPKGHAFRRATPAPAGQLGPGQWLQTPGSGWQAMDGHVGKTGPSEVNSVSLVLTRFKNKLKSRHGLKIASRAGERLCARSSSRHLLNRSLTDRPAGCSAGGQRRRLAAPQQGRWRPRGDHRGTHLAAPGQLCTEGGCSRLFAALGVLGRVQGSGGSVHEPTTGTACRVPLGSPSSYSAPHTTWPRRPTAGTCHLW